MITCQIVLLSLLMFSEVAIGRRLKREPQNTCDSWNPCPPGGICRNGQCVGQGAPVQCGWIRCDPGEFCVENSWCSSNPCDLCPWDTDCAAAGVCRENRNDPQQTCDSWNPCPPGGICRNGQCVGQVAPEPQNTCDSWNPCPPGGICRNGQCVGQVAPEPQNTCDSWNPCPPGGICRNGQCVGQGAPG